MRIERHKNFFSKEECDELNAWVALGVENRWLDAGLDANTPKYARRVTSRLYVDRYEYPQIVRDLSDRVRAFCGVAGYPIVEGHGRDGVVVSCTFPGGDVYPHKDGTHLDGTPTLRCNVMTRAADDGCVLHLEGQPIDIEVGELHCYLASEHMHFVTPAKGVTPRVLWMFGAHVPAEDWDNGKIKFGVA